MVPDIFFNLGELTCIQLYTGCLKFTKVTFLSYWRHEIVCCDFWGVALLMISWAIVKNHCHCYLQYTFQTGGLAQLDEHGTPKPRVVGSTPMVGKHFSLFYFNIFYCQFSAKLVIVFCLKSWKRSLYNMKKKNEKIQKVSEIWVGIEPGISGKSPQRSTSWATAPDGLAPPSIFMFYFRYKCVVAMAQWSWHRAFTSCFSGDPRPQKAWVRIRLLPTDGSWSGIEYRSINFKYRSMHLDLFVGIHFWLSFFTVL